LLDSESGVYEDTYSILRELVGAVLGGDALAEMDSRVEAFGGWFYYDGEKIDVDYNEEDRDSMSERLAALDALEGAAPEEDEVEEEDLEEVDLYDDLAD